MKTLRFFVLLICVLHILLFNHAWSQETWETIVPLFADEAFVQNIDSSTIKEAIVLKDTDKLIAAAWNLKGFELMTGKQDAKLHSGLLFDAAAELAVAQKNVKALESIVALNPSITKYSDALAVVGNSESSQKGICPMPQLIKVSSENASFEIAKLPFGQQPIIDNDMLKSFTDIPFAEANNICYVINNGRLTANPMFIALGAIELSKYKYADNLSQKLEPKEIFKEAVELAIMKNDKSALASLEALYGTSSFYEEDYAKEISENIVLMADTRGEIDDDTVGKAILIGIGSAIVFLIEAALK